MIEIEERTIEAGRGASGWPEALAADFRRAVGSRRWDRALFAMAWTHLAAFAACQAIYDPDVVKDPRHVAIWALDVVAALGWLRALAGPGWYRASPAVALVVRFWGTFLILSFSLATLNSLTGWSIHWFRPAWATLSSFLFASMAWLFTARFLLLAVQMYLTGLLLASFPHHCYLIYGASWCLALLILAREAARVGRHD